MIKVILKAKIILKEMVHKVIRYFSQYIFKKISSTDDILEWKSEALSDEVIKPPNKPPNTKIYWQNK